MNTDYLSAREAASALGVNVGTLYSYVSRKGLRSQPIPGTRKRRYWKADIIRLCNREKVPPVVPGDLRRESELTLLTAGDLFYRGRSAVKMSESGSLESVASLLWDCDETAAFETHAPQTNATFEKIERILAEEDEVDRASALFPILEAANPRAYDLSPLGMARTGADVLRCLAAITIRSALPSAEPVHLFIASRLRLSPALADVIRRLLVLAADHGFEAGALAVRAVASTGVTPWRSALCGLSATLGPRSRLGAFDATNRLLKEISASPDPLAPVIRRIRDGEALPGFGSRLYAQGDPRAIALLSSCHDAFPDDKELQRLEKVFAGVREIRGLRPNFALACLYIAGKAGLRPSDSLFHLGRTTGWIAHAIEQYRFGEAGHLDGTYRGKLPDLP